MLGFIPGQQHHSDNNDFSKQPNPTTHTANKNRQRIRIWKLHGRNRTVPNGDTVKPLRLLHALANDELEGNTLNVYAYIVHEAKPVGTRDVTRGANLSSTSVAHRHLQKLEYLGLIEKNSYGDYILKEKTSINGHVWVGRNLVPRLMFYSFFFLGAFGAEISLIMLSFLIKDIVIQVSFLFLTGMTAVAMILFLIEGILLHRKVNPKERQIGGDK
jgi:hypothetical protein